MRWPGEHQEAGTDLSRVKNLSDGVFSIVMTLLAFQLTPPPSLPADATDAMVFNALRRLEHPILCFVISFGVVALMWIVHHRLFRYITGYDQALLHRNILFLFTLCLVPFTSMLSTNFEGSRLTWAIYCANIALCAISMRGIWEYAIRNRHLDAQLPERYVRAMSARSWIAPIVMVVSALVGLWYLNVARYVPIAILPISALVSRRANSGQTEPPADGGR